MVNLCAVCASDSIRCELLTDAPREIGQRFEVLHVDFKSVVVAEEEPVAAPCHIAVDSFAVNGDRDMSQVAIGGDVLDGNFVGVF